MSGPGARSNERLRRLPPVDAVLARLGAEAPHELAVAAARETVAEAREIIDGGGEAPSLDAVVAAARARLARSSQELLGPVINATGVLIHTNLGRAPLGARQLNAVALVAGAYSNLEYDLAGGGRGDRYSHARSLLAALTGAESALVVNNNAAALLLVLTSLCRGRDVIISRGELIEIGGEFRIPEVMAQSGARLVEVGTTNRTHLADYERAITADTAAILRVHTSNYRIVGFTASVPGRDLARLARGRGLLLVNDLGSGLVDVADVPVPALQAEPPVDLALAEGADVVTFSGDKLLGGPQAGIIVGRAELVAAMARNPMLRALRVDKMVLAALEATLLSYLEDRVSEIPLWRMLTATHEELRARANALSEAIGDAAPAEVKVDVVASHAVTGGGSLPGTQLDSWAVAVDHPERSPNDLHEALRAGRPPVVARIEEDRLLLDVRTVLPGQEQELADAVVHAIRR